jgi:hypothetical protein
MHTLDATLKAAFEASLQTGKLLSYYVCASLPRFRAAPPPPATTGLLAAPGCPLARAP